jgi:WXXGXW repeat (2 copies)
MIGKRKRMRITFSVRSLLLAFVVLLMSAASFAQIGIAVRIGPPALPVYEQPVCPGDGYIWTPGYWAYDYDISDYYWVPGTWVEAPEVGFLWTPGYWGWGDGGYFFHTGYWGPHIGFYGGINYGFGYFGVGFEGGRWDNGHFFYNRAVSNVNVTNIHNVYNTTVVNNTVNRVSYNGGTGGIEARPTAAEEAAEHDRHIAPVAAQNEHVQTARGNPELRASANHGKPPIAATDRPGEFTGHGAVGAKEAGAAYKPEENRNAGETRAESPARPAVHPNDLPAATRPPAPNTGNAKTDKKYQQQQDKLAAKQTQERQNLQQKQDQEHQHLTQQKASQEKTQQVEQKHQQQTQQLQERHAAQQQSMQSHQAPAKPR